MRVFLVRAALAFACLLPGGLFLNAMPVHSDLPEDPRPCRAGTLYLTFNTGSMAVADHVAEVLRQEHVRATFFIDDDQTYVGDHVLDARWANYWRARVAEGHAFGNLALSRASFRKDLPDGRVHAVLPDGKAASFTRDRFCDEFNRVDERFTDLTGKHLGPLWRAPAGSATPRALEWAKSCGYSQPQAGVPNDLLGEDLSSSVLTNQVVFDRAVHTARDGAVLTVPMGGGPHREPFAALLRPLLTKLKSQGYCFAPLKG